MEYENDHEYRPHVVILHLIRHGYADHNQARDVYGSRAYFSNRYKFSSLVDTGKKQARDLRNRIIDNNIYFDRVYVSPLDRAIQTAIILFSNNRNLKVPNIFVTDDLRETNYAHPPNERRTCSQLQNLYPNFDYSLIQTNDDYFFKYGDKYNRFISILNEIKNICSNTDKILNIALISHESFLLEFANDYLNTELDSIDNCEIITLTIDLNAV